MIHRLVPIHRMGFDQSFSVGPHYGAQSGRGRGSVIGYTDVHGNGWGDGLAYGDCAGGSRWHGRKNGGPVKEPA